jgi:hypothetical protein
VGNVPTVNMPVARPTQYHTRKLCGRGMP